MPMKIDGGHGAEEHDPIGENLDGGHGLPEPLSPETIRRDRLFAAAPELLAALDALITRDDQRSEFANDAWYDREFAQARAVVAKARGG